MGLLDQLGKQEVPRPPAQLKQQVRERVNASLTVLQIADLALRGMPYVLLHLGKALVGLVLLTLTGTYEPRPRDDARGE